MGVLESECFRVWGYAASAKGKGSDLGKIRRWAHIETLNDWARGFKGLGGGPRRLHYSKGH